MYNHKNLILESKVKELNVFLKDALEKNNFQLVKDIRTKLSWLGNPDRLLNYFNQH